METNERTQALYTHLRALERMLTSIGRVNEVVYEARLYSKITDAAYDTYMEAIEFLVQEVTSKHLGMKFLQKMIEETNHLHEEILRSIEKYNEAHIVRSVRKEDYKGDPNLLILPDPKRSHRKRKE
jgi:hypothetical protein